MTVRPDRSSSLPRGSDDDRPVDARRAGPTTAGQRAGQRELADQLDEARIVGIGADRTAERGDQTGGGCLPIFEQCLFAGVEEDVTQPVRAGRQPG